MIIEAADEAHAIALANENRIWPGRSPVDSAISTKLQKLATQIESGNVFINAMVRSDARLPFGGVKQSGYGRELSLEGTYEFLNAKIVYIQQYSTGMTTSLKRNRYTPYISFSP